MLTLESLVPLLVHLQRHQSTHREGVEVILQTIVLHSSTDERRLNDMTLLQLPYRFMPQLRDELRPPVADSSL
jgi:hypothetical protein